MKTARLPLLALLLLATLPLTATAADPAPAPAAAKAEEEPPKSFAEYLTRSGVKLTAGPTKVALGTVAEFALLDGQHFVGSDSLDRYYELTQNMRSGSELGVVVSTSGWVLVFKYNDSGYVKDDDKDKLEADKLLAAMREGEQESNAARRKRGWDEMKVQGWAAAPHYDEKTHNLTWALNLSSSQDNHKEIWINQSIRLLGRGGIMNVTLVTDPDKFTTAVREVDGLLAGNFNYLQGQRYAEWKPGDKVAAYGLSALVLGGGAAVAAKMGWLAQFGAMLGKGWKVVVLAVAGLGAGIAKLWRRFTGSQPSE